MSRSPRRTARRAPRGCRTLRLGGGEYGGRTLTVPEGVRPTEARVREALFSIWGARIAGATVADLFSGSGAVALEVLGRGALEAVAVEGEEAVADELVANRERLGASGLTVRRGRLPIELDRMQRDGAGPFHLVFADPPYRYPAYDRLLAGLPPLLTEDGEVVVEHSRRVALPDEADGLVQVDRRRYGETALSFYRRAAR